MIKGEYHPRNPRASPLYQIVEDYWEDFERCYEERFERTHGYFRGVIRKAFFAFLECGDLKRGFARIHCAKCGTDMLLAFSCKCRYFCPSCHMKRTLTISAHLVEEVLKEVPIRHWVFTIPKMLRPYFRHNKRLLGLLAKCAWECLWELYASVAPQEASRGGIPGAVIAVHTAGGKLNFHPHVHALVSDGAFVPSGDFLLLPTQIDVEMMERLFQYKVLSMLRREGKIPRLWMEKFLTWRHSGFNCHSGARIEADDQEAREQLARYIIRAPLSLEKLSYVHPEGKVFYGFRDSRKPSHPLEFLAELTQHIPDYYEHRIHYYGAYSSKTRGMNAKQHGRQEPHLKKPETSLKSCRSAWAALIAKVYEIDPLICQTCKGQMKIVAFLKEEETVRKILKHLNLWDSPQRAPPTKVTLLIQETLWPKYPERERCTALSQTVESREPYSFDPDVPTELWLRDPEYEYV